MKLKIGLAILQMAAYAGGAAYVQHRQSEVQAGHEQLRKQRSDVRREADGTAARVGLQEIAYTVPMTRAARGQRGEEVKPLAGLGTVLMGAAGFCVWMSARTAGAKEAERESTAREVQEAV